MPLAVDRSKVIGYKAWHAADHDPRKWHKAGGRKGIQLADTPPLFDGRPFVETVDRESDPAEVRFKRTGFDRRGRLLTSAYTWRYEARRMITAWKATSD